MKLRKLDDETAYPELPKAKEEEKQTFNDSMNEWNMNIGLKKSLKDGVMNNQNVDKGIRKDKMKIIQEKKVEFKSDEDYLVKENNDEIVLSDFIFVTTTSKKKKKKKS